MLRPGRRWAALTCIAVVTACGGAKSPSVAGPAATSQGVIFDASISASAGTLLAYTLVGIRVDTGPGGFPCPPAVHIAPGGIAVLAPQSVGAQTIELGPAFDQAAGEPPEPDPSFLDGIENDCDLVATYDELVAYLDAACSSAKATIAQLELCVGLAEVVYCDVVEKVEIATTVGFRTRVDTFARNFAPGSHGRRLPRGSLDPCAELQLLLYLFPQAIDALRFEHAGCEDALTGLEDVLARTETMHTESEKQVRLRAADAYLSDAHTRLERGRELLAELQAAKAGFVLADLQASCSRCGPQFMFEPPPAAGAVLRRRHWDPLAPVVAALDAAAAATSDPNEKDRHEELARRLRQTPGDRVLHVTFRGRGEVGMDYVVLSHPPAQDDGSAPLVVVLSALPASADLPEPNVSDLSLLYAGYRDFGEALHRAP